MARFHEDDDRCRLIDEFNLNQGWSTSEPIRFCIDAVELRSLRQANETVQNVGIGESIDQVDVGLIQRSEDWIDTQLLMTSLSLETFFVR
jgi:hypothetical protein